MTFNGTVPDEPSRPLDGMSMLQADAEGWVSARPIQVVEILQRLIRFPWLLVKHWDLLTTSVKRDLGARFTGTILGWIWPLLHPLFLFIVYYFIFTKLLQFKMIGLPVEKQSAMGVYMFVGILSWAMISEALGRGTGCIVDNGNLIKKLAFPSELLPLNVTLAGLVTFAFGLLTFIVACYVTPLWVPPGWKGLLWVPLLMLLQCVFTYGLVLFLSSIHVFLRDTLQVVTVLTTVWMFATPLFWVPELLPGESSMMWLIKANPIYHLVTAWRGALMGDVSLPDATERRIVEGDQGFEVIEVVTREAFTAVSPDFVAHSTSVFAIWTVAIFVLGFVFFSIAQRRFADEV